VVGGDGAGGAALMARILDDTEAAARAVLESIA